MKLKCILLIAGVFLAALSLAACNLPSTGTCPTASLQAVTLGAPAMWSVVDSLTPTLNWTYPDSTCTPEGYRVELRTGPLFTDDLSGGTGNPSTTWSPGSPLQPGREYEWAIRPINGTTLGPIAGYHYFFTGPQCATAALSAPALLQPDDGSEVHELEPSLIWQYLDPCVPQGYRVDLSTDASFADTSLSGGTGNPSTRWGPGHPLADCTTYFWRTAPINDTTLGPFSGVFSFHTNAGGSCAPESTATVRGVVWTDQCPLPLDTSPVPSPLPAGCAVTAYGVDADAIHEPGEPFMNNLTVNLGSGDCPSGGPMHTVTDVNGNYQFTGLTPGNYCLNINAATFVGPGGTGHWTLIPSGHEGNTYRAITLSAGQTLTGQDFAWYEFSGGSTPTPTSVAAAYTSTPTPASFSFTPDFNANCHLGPDPLFDTLDVAMKGTSYPLDGQNQAHTWYRILLSPLKGCWVLATSGKPSGDVSGLRVLISPLLPTATFTPTEVIDCSSYTDIKSCQAQPACVWKPALTHPGDCTIK